jgi:cobalt-zinc-cadmium efflux system outer membrane protein
MTRVFVLALSLGMATTSARADGLAVPARLTLDDALRLARARAPEIVSARLRLAEARGRLAGATARSANPEIELAAGPRRGDSRSTDFDLGVSQRFEPIGLRAARIAGAEARLAETAANADETTRAVLREVARTYYQAVYAAERVRLATATETVAAAVLDAADRRHRAGDIAVLDVNLARAALARARADRRAGEAERTTAMGALEGLLQLEGPIGIDGTLSPGQPPDMAALARATDDRPELRALSAALREADAEVATGRSLAKPELGLAARYAREEGRRIVLAGVTISLPVYAKGREQVAVGSARASRLRAELDAARSRIRIELETALAAYEARLAAVRVLEAEALPSVDENEALTERSFEVGQIGLPDLLLIRRELVETRAQYLTAALEAALARVDIDAAAGVLR